MRKSKGKSKPAVLVTDLAEFYRCDGSEGQRFYPAAPSRKAAAIDYNGGILPPTVRGFGVYDTTVTMDFAVALYADKAEAKKHEGTPAPAPAKTIFEDKTDDDKFEFVSEDATETEDEDKPKEQE